MIIKIAFLAAFAALSLQSPAFAAGKEHGKKQVKLLNDAASALAVSNPDLSSRLKAYASKESGETKAEEGRNTGAKMEDEQKLLSESAAALKGSRPDLAKKLEKYAKDESKEHRGKSGLKGHLPETKGQSMPEPAPKSGY